MTYLEYLTNTGYDPAKFWAGIGDLSGRSTYRSRGPMTDVGGVIFHHTGGRGSAEGVVDTLNKRGYATQFIIDRNGNIYRGLPDGYRGAQIKTNSDLNLSNANTIGVEVVGNDNTDITPAQVTAGQALAKALMAKYNISPESIYGHGEVNPGHKMSDEGLAIVNPLRSAFGLSPVKINADTGWADVPAPTGQFSYSPMPSYSPAAQAVNSMAVGELPPPPKAPALPGVNSIYAFGGMPSLGIGMKSPIGSGAMPGIRQGGRLADLVARATAAAKSGSGYPTGAPGPQGNGIIAGPSGVFKLLGNGMYESLTSGRKFSLNPGMPR